MQAWSSVEATPGRVRDALSEDVPGTGDSAALQVPTVLSVGGGAPVRSQVSPAREPDRRPLTRDESWRGCGLRADRGDARLERLRAGQAHAVRCVIRLQDTWKPKGDDRARGQVTGACCPGTDCEARLAEASLVREGRAMDADGPIGGTTPPLPLRLVGIQRPTGSGLFLTHRPPRLGPLQVADRSRVRWEVARSLRLDTSVHRRDAVDTAQPCALQTLRYASRMASPSAARLAHTHTRKPPPPPAGAPRPAAPLHPRRLAWPLAVSWQSMAEACQLQGVVAKRRWEKIAEWLTHSGKDPHWRRRPSVLDQ